jgi:Papain family cysteine protease
MLVLRVCAAAVTVVVCQIDFTYSSVLTLCTQFTLCVHSPVLRTGWIKADADEKSVMAAVAKGPLSVGIQADQLAFQLYRDGVFSAPCGTDLDHGVVLVGYGTDEETDLPYWKVKNSWGASWGE